MRCFMNNIIRITRITEWLDTPELFVTDGEKNEERENVN